MIDNPLLFRFNDSQSLEATSFCLNDGLVVTIGLSDEMVDNASLIIQHLAGNLAPMVICSSSVSMMDHRFAPRATGRELLGVDSAKKSLFIFNYLEMIVWS